MKKVLLLSKICLMAMCLIFGSLSVYAATDNVPKTVNIQGRYTRNYGDPISNTQIRVYFQVKKGSAWESVQGSPFSTTTDSEGLYNLNITVNNFSSDMTHFRVGIDSEPTDTGYAFASSPYAIYSSTAAYALSLDPINGDKLVDENFKSDTYNITVANAVLATTANNALKVSTETASGKNGFVWGITDNSGTQTWVDPGEIQIHEATTGILGGILLGNSDTGLVMKGDNKTLKIKNGAGLLINNSNELVLDFGSIDSTNITKSVTGKAIYDELAKKQDTLTGTNVTTTGSGNVVDSVTASNGVLTITKNTTLAAVATSGSYTDLLNKPTIPAAQVNSDWNATSGVAQIINKPTLATVATSGSYNDLLNKPTLATVATSGSYTDLLNKPTIPAAQVNSDWNATSGVAQIYNKPTLADVATSGSYNDLSNKPTIPSYSSGDAIDITSNNKISVKYDNNTIKVNGSGQLYVNTEIVGADLAEIYQSSEKLVPGDVVSIDTTKDNSIVKTKVAEDTLVAGVISTEPGVLMNQKEKGYKLALVGKVPTKVCNEGGAVKRGDLLVSASIPGYAKKAGDNPKAGTVIGKALENLDSQKGTILVLVNLQ